MTNATYTTENTPSSRAPFAADVVVAGKVVAERVMVHPATTRTTYCNGTPILVEVNYVDARGVIDSTDPDWCQERGR